VPFSASRSRRARTPGLQEAEEMASIPCTIQLSARAATSRRTTPRAAVQGLRTPLQAGAGRRLGWLRPSRLSGVVPASESGRVGTTCWFRFGNKDAEGAGIYGSQGRDDFDRDDVEQVSLSPFPLLGPNELFLICICHLAHIISYVCSKESECTLRCSALVILKLRNG
jgi:hypothetical protein